MNKCPYRKFITYQYGFNERGDRELRETIEYFADCEGDKCEYYSRRIERQVCSKDKIVIESCKLNGLTFILNGDNKLVK